MDNKDLDSLDCEDLRKLSYERLLYLVNIYKDRIRLNNRNMDILTSNINNLNEKLICLEARNEYLEKDSFSLEIDVRDENSKLKEANKQLSEQVRALELRNKYLEHDYFTLEMRNNELKESVSENDKLKERIKELKVTNDNLNRENHELKDKLSDYDGQLGNILDELFVTRYNTGDIVARSKPLVQLANRKIARENEELKEKNKQLRSMCDEYENICDKLEEEKEQLIKDYWDSRYNYDRLLEECCKFKVKYEGLETKYNDLKYDYDCLDMSYVETIEDYDNLLDRLQEGDAEIERLNNYIKDKQSHYDKLKDKYRKRSKEYEQLRVDFKQLEKDYYTVYDSWINQDTNVRLEKAYKDVCWKLDCRNAEIEKLKKKIKDVELLCKSKEGYSIKYMHRISAEKFDIERSIKILEKPEE